MRKWRRSKETTSLLCCVTMATASGIMWASMGGGRRVGGVWWRVRHHRSQPWTPDQLEAGRSSWRLYQTDQPPSSILLFFTIQVRLDVNIMHVASTIPFKLMEFSAADFSAASKGFILKACICVPNGSYAAPAPVLISHCSITVVSPWRWPQLPTRR